MAMTIVLGIKAYVNSKEAQGRMVHSGNSKKFKMARSLRPQNEVVTEEVGKVNNTRVC